MRGFLISVVAFFVASISSAQDLPPVEQLQLMNGDAQKGHVVFSAFCASCHRIGAEGADFAPGLGDVSKRLQRPDLFKSILTPSAVIAAGFETYAIKTISGEMQTGLIGSESPKEVVLRTSATTTVSFKRANIKLMKKLETSTMPEGLAQAIGAQGLADVVAFLGAPFPPEAPKLELNQGDHIAIIGNTLADRMQHDGTFDAMIHKANAEKDIVIRNLGFSGDELETRLRSEAFGSPEDWLKKVKADVVFAFFGFNESFAGNEGLQKFRVALDKFIKSTMAANYSGKGSPKLVLFSPIADLTRIPKDPAKPENLNLYISAQSEIARANGVLFVDLYTPSLKIGMAEPDAYLGNKIHLRNKGYEKLAPEMFKGVFGKDAPAIDADFEKLRLAVRERNEMFFSRYRTVDGYNVYGGRSNNVYMGISNQKVMQEEMTVRDVMTENRERRVWALSRGYDAKIDDSNLPKITVVPTNKPKISPYLNAEEAIKEMTVPKGVKVNLFASEEQFPDLIKPVQMAFDTKGRLWVAVWPTYPERTPSDKKGDSIIILEDTDGDGKADKCTTYLGDLNSPTGFQFYKDGILLMQAPDLWHVETNKATGLAGSIERVLNGIDSADSHHTTNAMALEPGGATYLSDGVFHRTQVETAIGPVRNVDAAIFRYEPVSHKFQRYIPYGFANPHGRVFDHWGNDYITDATGNENYFGPAFSGFIDYPATHSGMRHFWPNPSRPCPGTGILSSRVWPEEYNGNFLNCNVISFQGVYRAKIVEDGSGMKGISQEHLIFSKDPNFRPMQAVNAPDGSVFVSDWSNSIIGHLQHHIRDPQRDHTHGRIYRLTYEGKTMKPAVIDGQSIDALLALLKEPELNTRERAKIELHKHPTAEVMASVDRWIASLDKAEPGYEHHVTEGLWVKQWHDVVDEALLKKQLRSPDSNARFAATRVLCYWRDRISDPLGLLKAQVNDESPRVRLEAVRALSFFQQWEAADIALEALKKPRDYYLDYVLKETIRQLSPWWRKAIADGEPFCKDNPSGINEIISTVGTGDLAKLPPTPEVLAARLTRDDATQPMRLDALNEIAAQRNVSKINLLCETLEQFSKKGGRAAGELSSLLLLQPAADLKAARPMIAKLMEGAAQSDARHAAKAALMLAEGSLDAAWGEAQKTPGNLIEFLDVLPMIPDPVLRATAFEKVSPLLTALPPEIAKATEGKTGVSGRYVRIELPRVGTLTLAEVQVFSGGKNVALGGKARQSSTGYGGEAKLAIDGRTNGDFSSGTQTHTNENEKNPWWEVDLQSEQMIDAVVVWNRTESDYGMRLDGFDLVVLDGARKEVFRKKKNSAPKESGRIELSGDPRPAIQKALVGALVSTGREPQWMFNAFADWIEKGIQFNAASAAIRQLPHNAWNKDRAPGVMKALIAWAQKVPESQRTGGEYVQNLATARDLAALLPEEQAAAARKEIRAMTVDVFTLRTVREQMRYDSARLVVEPGKQFQVTLENNDMMPHNIAFVMPGSRKEIAEAAQTMKPEKLDGAGRAYMPESPKIFAASKLVPPGQVETLRISAPKEEGECEFVCTFPGHWTLMWGTLVVTKDPEGYIATHPAPLPPAGIPPADHKHE